MSLEQVAHISTIVQAILVTASLIFIWFQLRQSVELTKAANAQALVEHFTDFSALLMKNPEVASLWYAKGKGLKKEEDFQRYRELLVLWLIFHENVYYQYSKRLLDHQIYQSWHFDLRDIVRGHNLSMLGIDLPQLFPGEFGQHLLHLQQQEGDTGGGETP